MSDIETEFHELTKTTGSFILRDPFEELEMKFSVVRDYDSPDGLTLGYLVDIEDDAGKALGRVVITLTHVASDYGNG